MSHRALVWLTAILLVGGAVTWGALAIFRTEPIAPVAWERPLLTAGQPTRPVTLYFGDASDWRLASEDREVVRDGADERFVGNLVRELTRGSLSHNRSLFSERARVRSVHVTAVGELVIDFYGSPFSSDATAPTCYLALMSLLRVVVEEVPRVKTVSMLVDGSPISRSERRLAIPVTIPARATLDDFAARGGNDTAG